MLLLVPVVLLTASQLNSFWLVERSRNVLAYKAARDVPLLGGVIIRRLEPYSDIRASHGYLCPWLSR